MKKHTKKPIKTSKLITSTQKTPRLEIEQHFQHSKKIIPNQGVESLPFVLDSEESVKNLNLKLKDRVKIPKPPPKQVQNLSPDFNLSDLSDISLDKKVELLNNKISAIEQDIAYSFRSQSNLHEKTPHTPIFSKNYPSECSIVSNRDHQELILNPNNSSRDFMDIDHYSDWNQFSAPRNDSVKPKSSVNVVPLFDLSRFDKPVIAKDDPSYNLRNEIAEYRKNLKKHVLPERIEKILSEKCKKNISVQYEEQFVNESESLDELEEGECKSTESMR